MTRGTASGPAWSLRSPRLEREPGHVGVQGEADGVEQAGLARAGGPVDEEEPLGRQRVEVDDDPVGERPERLDLEPVQPHAAPADPAGSTRDDALVVADLAGHPAGLDGLGEQRPLVVAGRAPAAHVAEEVAADLDVGGGRDPRARTAAAAPWRPAGRSAARG